MSGNEEEGAPVRLETDGERWARSLVEGRPVACITPWELGELSGVVLDFAADGDELRVVLVDKAGREAMTLGPFPEEDVIAVWRAIAIASGLTPMMRAWNGQTEPLACQLGRLRLGKAHDRKRLVVLNGRRPRFLVRRKSARLPVRPLVFREPEIAGGRGR
jgi:hypothetical protein